MQLSPDSSLEDDHIRRKLGVIENQPKYPEYATLQRRIESFEKWPKHLKKHQKPKRMAEAGFAYTGSSDAVRCFHCGNGLRNWKRSDNPWKQHALHFRDCAHVRQCKGDDYIRAIHGETTDLEMDGDCTDTEVNLVKQWIENNSVAVSAAKEFDTNDSDIEKVVNYFIQRRIEVSSAVDIVKTLEQIEAGLSDTKTDDRLEHKEPDQPVDEKKENESLKENITCKVCFDARACIITIPCGHMVTCPQCIGPLKKCSICRSTIKGTVRAFMSDNK